MISFMLKPIGLQILTNIMFCLYINYVSCGFLLYVCIACKFGLVYVIQSYYIYIMYVDSFLCSNTTIVN